MGLIEKELKEYSQAFEGLKFVKAYYTLLALHEWSSRLKCSRSIQLCPWRRVVWEDNPIAFESQKLLKVERFYTIQDELLTMVHCLEY